jgi:hypothetical protein
MSEFASFSSFLTPAVAGEGKSGGDTGGGLFGAVPTGKGKVPLRFLDISYLGLAFCGGVVGVGRKRMCCLHPDKCTVSSHKLKVMTYNDFPALVAATTDQGVFIEAPDGRSVYLSSHVPLAFLGDNPEAYREQHRSVAQWEQFLSGLRASDEADLPSEADRTSYFKHVFEKANETTFKTPFKKRRVVVEDSSASPFRGSGASPSTPEDTFMADVSSQLDPVNTVPMLLKEWPLLVNMLTTLQGLVLTCRESLKAVTQQIAKDLREVDFSIADVANAVGKKPVEMEAGTVFELIESIERQVKEQNESVANQGRDEALEKVTLLLSGFDPNGSNVKEVFDLFREEVKSVLNPLWSFLSSVSSSPARPGDKLRPLLRVLDDWPSTGIGGDADVLTWIQRTERLVSTLAAVRARDDGQANARSAATARNSSPLGMNFGNTGSAGGGAYSFQQNTSGPSNQGASGPPTAAAFAALQQEVSDLRAQAEQSSVTIAGQVFKSLEQVVSWMTLHASDKGAHVAFADASGLLAITYRDQTTAMDHAKVNALAGKGEGFVTVADIKLDFSFSLDLPHFFGKDVSANILTADARVLPNIKNYADWNGVAGGGGVRMTLSHYISNDMNHIQAGVNLGGSREAQLVSDAMIRESKDFLSQLSLWITDHYCTLTDKGHKEADAWEVISRSVRAIFKEISKVRMKGRGYQTASATRGHAQVWACFQGLRMQREFLDARFSAHKAVINILHEYLMDTSVTKEEHTRALAAQETRLMAYITTKLGEIKRAKTGGG